MKCDGSADFINTELEPGSHRDTRNEAVSTALSRDERKKAVKPLKSLWGANTAA